MKNNSGFTIMELMVIIAIVGIISAIAIPNMISWRANHQLNGTAREMKSLINGARISAIKNNAIVTVTYDAGTRTVEASYTNRARPPYIEETLSTAMLKTGVTITGSTFADNGFRFNSRGLPIKIADNSFASGHITLTGSNGAKLEVWLASTGNTRIDKP